MVGITKNSVTSVNKSYWNYNNLNSKDPVAGLFSERSFEALEKAERRIKREKKKEKALKSGIY